jgi:hypothetical protein
VKKDCIAPFLSCGSNDGNIVNKIQRRYRNGVVNLPLNYTMHTESSSKNLNYKDKDKEGKI